MKLWPSLSISSSRISGLFVPACRIAAMMRPGIEPTYVLRWPMMSASSRTPPSDTRTYLRPVASAIDRAIDVLPTPGGPTRQMIWPVARSESFRTASVSRKRSLTFCMP